MTAELTVEYCGEEFPLSGDRNFTIGRDADLVVDDNAYLHRQLAELSFADGFWWVANVGTRLSLTVSGEAGTLHAVLAPGARVPIVLPSVALLFTAGQTTYEVNVSCDVPTFNAVPQSAGPDGLDNTDMTLGSVNLTSSQFLMVLSLCENALRRSGTGPTDLPTNAQAADRLGWPITRFNRKLDNVCDKFDRAGVQGLRGGRGNNATQRRARLVEYAVTARIVRPEHLPLLDEETAP
ncbi:hypothetical protein KUV85_07965 [Nocardioides panacisoli]|uniref:FHA domain-containing protein n=1 Tax=Nocardioides panacisoli TaxID=627624 RepID=UPI001C630368|nr:FHA domain-containing protein [Nocardioides panacisoli]QYJ05601.1 hypothetical protein KUV85_07965 [Nocardioides panacisoli]